MGYLGYLFEICDDRVEGGYSEAKEFIVVFFERPNATGSIVIGLQSSFPQDISSYFLSKDLEFAPFHILEKSRIKYAKASVNDQKVIDLRHLTVWLKGKDVNRLRTILTVSKPQRKIEEELKVRTNELSMFL